jgi:GT2 family glycosyltransferase
MNFYCLIVTFNRRKCLQNLLDSLFNQSLKITGLIIINNNSTDDTVPWLIKEGIITSSLEDKVNCSTKNGTKILFFNSLTNLGGSGGFELGFKIAKEYSFDYLWVMDDDVMPEENCLELLSKCFDENHEVVVPARDGVNFHDQIIHGYRFTNPFVHTFLSREKIAKTCVNEKIEVKAFTFEGPLFSHHIIEEVGLPDASYFLQGDDYDYAFRCLKHTSIYYIPSAILHRQIPVAKSNSLTYWRLYYSLRNAALLDYRYSKAKIFAEIRVFNFKLKWLLISIKRKDQIEKKIVKLAFYDAKHGLTGKRINPGDFNK